VDAHADPELDSWSEVVRGEGLLRFDCRGDGVVGFRKGVEEGVSLGVDLDARVSKCGAQEGSVVGEDVFVAGAEGGEQAVEPSISVNTRVTVPGGSSVTFPTFV
jgi:hypothetical protein